MRLDREGVVQVLLNEQHDLGGVGGGKADYLRLVLVALFADDLEQDLLKVRGEDLVLVQLVSFVHHKQLHLGEIEELFLQHLHEAAYGADGDGAPLGFDDVSVLLDGQTPDEEVGLKVFSKQEFEVGVALELRVGFEVLEELFEELGEDVHDLDGKFACGREDESEGQGGGLVLDDRICSGALPLVLVETKVVAELEDGDKEAEGFSGASLCLANDVLPLEDEGYGLALDERGRPVVHLRERGDNVLIDCELAKGHN